MSGPAPTAPVAPQTPRALGFDPRKLLLSEYNPETDGVVNTWLTSTRTSIRADEFIVGAQWPQEALYYIAGSKLRGSAATMFEQLEAILMPAQRRFDVLEARLLQQYGTKLTEAAAVNKIMGRKKMTTESYQEYAMELRKLVEGVTVAENFFVEAFEDGLGDFTGSLVRNAKPTTLMDAVHAAVVARGGDGRGVETTLATAARPRSARTAGRAVTLERGEPAAINLVSTAADDGEDGEEENEEQNQQYRPAAAGGKRKWQGQQQGEGAGGDSHYGPRPVRQRVDQSRVRSRNCYGCGDPNHMIADCPLLKEVRELKAKKDQEN